MSGRHSSYAELEAALPELERSPRERGTLELIKRRRAQQLTVINSRLVALLAQTRERWPLAGDQLYVDFDLSLGHLPAGARLAIGAAQIEVSPEPHTGCRLFAKRYGRDARRFVGSERGHALQLRGINAWVVTGGDVRVGDEVRALFD